MKKMLIVVQWLFGLALIAWWGHGSPSAAPGSDSPGRGPTNLPEKQ